MLALLHDWAARLRLDIATDGAAISASALAVIDKAPKISAVLSLAYIAIRLWETKTLQAALRRLWCEVRGRDDDAT